MTPLQIEILIHYHSMGSDHKDVFNQAISQKEAFAYFVKEGYLKINTVGYNMKSTQGIHVRTYSPTDKLHFYCEALCQVPEPEPAQKWVIPLHEGESDE